MYECSTEKSHYTVYPAVGNTSVFYIFYRVKTIRVTQGELSMLVFMDISDHMDISDLPIASQ